MNMVDNPEMRVHQDEDNLLQPEPSSDLCKLTQLLTKQQVRASLPVKQVFSEDPLKFTTFMKAFEYAVQDKTTESKDKLNFLYLYTSGEPESLANSCSWGQTSQFLSPVAFLWWKCATYPNMLFGSQMIFLYMFTKI